MCGPVFVSVVCVLDCAKSLQTYLNIFITDNNSSSHWIYFSLIISKRLMQRITFPATFVTLGLNAVSNLG